MSWRTEWFVSVSSARSVILQLSEDALLEAVRAQAGLSEQSERRLLEVMWRFLRFVDKAFGVESPCEVTSDHAARFVTARAGLERRSPSVATSHLRRSAVRLLFRVLREQGVVEHDPTLD